MTSAPPLEALAPAAIAAFVDVEARAHAQLGPALHTVVAAALGVVLRDAEGGDPEPVDGDADPRAAALVAFAEQFAIDVTGIDDAHRSALGAAFGAATFPVVQSVYVLDQLRRSRIALRRILGVEPPTPPRRAEPGDLWAALEHFMREVARLDRLDPALTELVRLRGARIHECRLCQSRRSLRAIDRLGVEALEADAPIADPAAAVAVELAALVVTQPAEITDDLVDRVRAHLDPPAVLELVLDVARNAANKIAVAFAADAATVTDGVEYFDLDADGEVIAAVDPDVVRAATGSPRP